MKKFAWSLALAALTACTHAPAPKPVEERRAEARDLFAGGEGCFLLYNLRSKDFEQVHNKAYCYERTAAGETFAAPALVITADAGLPGDTTRDALAAKLGAKKLKAALRRLGYGNRSFAAPKISPFEQADFLERLWKGELSAGAPAQEQARERAFRKESQHGFELRAISGRGSAGLAEDQRLGWFAGHLAGRDREYLVVTRFAAPKDEKGSERSDARAEAITKELLEVNGLW